MKLKGKWVGKITQKMLKKLRDHSIEEYMANFGEADVIKTDALIIMNPDGMYDCLIYDEFGDLVRAEEIVRENKDRIWTQENSDRINALFDYFSSMDQDDQKT